MWRIRNLIELNKYQKKSITLRQRTRDVVWYALSSVLVTSFIPGSTWRIALLRLFGAQLGSGIVVKPRVSIKFPWRLSVGDNSWIGEGVWIDNLASVSIGSNACISQGVYLCTGSHNWSSERFDLVVKPISIGDQSWVCARAVVGPGAQIGEGGVVGLGCIFSGVLEPWTIVTSQAGYLRKRCIVSAAGAHE